MTKVSATKEESFFLGRASTIAFPAMADERGKLFPVEFSELPFVPNRAFVVQDVPVGSVRGGHAHSYGQELLLCLGGRIAVRLRFDSEEHTVVLDSPARGLLVDAGVWAEQKYLEPGTTLCVFSSEAYDPANYDQKL